MDAFKDATIQSNIATITGGIAVTYCEWDGSTSQSQVVGWTHITNEASSDAFADAISSSPRAFTGPGLLTAPGSAINWAVPLFTTNIFEGTRKVIDISGDGRQNDGANTFLAATSANALGLIVNGLAILTDDANLDVWYQNNIVTPGGGSLWTASEFGDAIKEKIGEEITVPDASMLLLLSSGFLGLAVFSRKYKRS